jgi:hypothetical protein
MLPSADQIRMIEGKPRPLRIEPWVAAHLSRVWQSMKKNIETSIAVGTQEQPRSVQSVPASARSHS